MTLKNCSFDGLTVQGAATSIFVPANEMRSPPSGSSTTPFTKRSRIIASTARSGAACSNPAEPTESPPAFGLLVGGAFSSGTLVLAICTY